jgi:hypothetical protein
MDEAQQTIIQNILNSKKAVIDELNNKKISISTRLQDIQLNQINKIKKTCYNEYMWFVKNGIIAENSNGLDFSIKDAANTNLAREKIIEFDECIIKNNLNIEGIKFEENKQSKASYNRCSKWCLLKEDSSLFESCYLNCFDEYVSEMNKSYKDMEDKLGKY